MKIERVEWDGSGARRLAARLRSLAPPREEVAGAVGEIVRSVRDRGDEALREISAELGEQAPDSWRVDPEAIEAAPGLLDPEVREAMRVVGWRGA